MRVKYEDLFNSEEETEGSLADAVAAQVFEYDAGVVEAATRKAEAAINFTELVVDMLWAKGLITLEDVATLVSKITLCKEYTVEVLPEED